MGRDNDKIIWTLISMAGAISAGVAARRLLDLGWKATAKTPPPTNPADSDTAWTEALLWTSVTGLCVGFARLFARRGMASGYRRITGHKPPGF